MQIHNQSPIWILIENLASFQALLEYSFRATRALTYRLVYTAISPSTEFAGTTYAEFITEVDRRLKTESKMFLLRPRLPQFRSTCTSTGGLFLVRRFDPRVWSWCGAAVGCIRITEYKIANTNCKIQFANYKVQISPSLSAPHKFIP